MAMAYRAVGMPPGSHVWLGRRCRRLGRAAALCRGTDPAELDYAQCIAAADLLAAGG